MEETKNPAHVLAKRLQENRKSLYIARIPDKTKANFIALAGEDFCGDYGMTLKWLMDDLISPDTKMIMEQISEINLRLDSLENGNKSEDVSEKSSRKMLDGTARRRLEK